MVNVFVVHGKGIGCQEEVAYAYEEAGADSSLVHINELLNGDKSLFDSQIINFSGGFLQGDIPEAGMSAANEINHASIHGNKFKDLMLEFVERGNLIYGQCNGFQLLVKTGLLPGIKNDYSKQTVTLTSNEVGPYRVASVQHIKGVDHFAFDGISNIELRLMCRHGEGNMQFYSPFGLVKEQEANKNLKKVLKKHVLLYYADPSTMKSTEEFPHNPNGSVNGIAGLTNKNGRIFGQMGHPEVSLLKSRDVEFYNLKDDLLRTSQQLSSLNTFDKYGVGFKIFENIVNYFG